MRTMKTAKKPSKPTPKTKKGGTKTALRKLGIQRFEVRSVARSEVKNAPYNPRRISKKSKGRLERLLKKHGLLEPLVWNKRTGNLVSGHQRLSIIDAIEENANWTADMSVVDLSESEEREANVGFNNDEAMGEFNPDLLADVLKFDGVDVLGTGFEQVDLKRLLSEEQFLDVFPGERTGNEDDDAAPEASEQLRRKWGVELGHMWRVGGSRILCGDSTKPEDVERLMSGEKACLVNTDPPYGVDYVGVKDGIPRSGFRDMKERKVEFQNDDLTDGAKLQAFLERMIRSALPYLVDDTAWYLWHPMLTQGTFFAAAAADIVIHRQIIWVKPGFVLTRSGFYHWKHELSYLGWRRGHKIKWYGDKSQTTVWEVGRDDDKGMHPTQKPLELFLRPIKNHTKQGELCYEPFSGSGSQVIAAEVSGRRCAAMELDPRYVAVLLERAKTRGFECELMK